MTIIHIVQFGFKELCTPEEIKAVCDAMLALKDQCIHPTTQKPYIKSASGGVDNSPEGHQGGITHIFVSEFESDEDRKYYLEHDPAHQAFQKLAESVLGQLRVVDYSPGVF